MSKIEYMFFPKRKTSNKIERPKRIISKVSVFKKAKPARKGDKY